MKTFRWQALVAAAALALTTLPAAAAAPDQQAAADRASTLKIAIGNRVQDPTNMNLYAPGVSRSDTGLHQIVYEYFFYNNLQTGEFIPWLATDYQYSPDYTSMTVKLRDGVTWNDGQPFNADDVVFTYDLLKKNPSMVWAEEANSNVASVDKIDDLNVRFNLKKPDASLLATLSDRAGMMVAPEAAKQAGAKFGLNPVCSGPYKFVERVQQDHITLARNPNYWNAKAFSFDKIVFRTIPGRSSM